MAYAPITGFEGETLIRLSPVLPLNEYSMSELLLVNPVVVTDLQSPSLVHELVIEPLLDVLLL